MILIGSGAKRQFHDYSTIMMWSEFMSCFRKWLYIWMPLWLIISISFELRYFFLSFPKRPGWSFIRYFFIWHCPLTDYLFFLRQAALLSICPSICLSVHLSKSVSIMLFDNIININTFWFSLTLFLKLIFQICECVHARTQTKIAV